MIKNMMSISAPGLKRLPNYLEILNKVSAEKKLNAISCHYIGRLLKIDPTLIQKDLMAIGAKGSPRTGYSILDLKAVIEDFLGWNNLSDAFLVGAGNLGRALVGYEGFEIRGIRIAAIFDNDPAKIGKETFGKTIMDVKKFASLCKRMKIKIGIMTVPSSVAQEIADMMVSSGIIGIWNFTQRNLNVPEDIVVENVDLASSLASLCGRLRENIK